MYSFHVSAPDHHTTSLGLYAKRNLLPYFSLIGTGVATSILAIYATTKEPANTGNRISILNYFVLSCIYLTVCRLAWEFVDYIARSVHPSSI